MNHFVVLQTKLEKLFLESRLRLMSFKTREVGRANFTETEVSKLVNAATKEKQGIGTTPLNWKRIRVASKVSVMILYFSSRWKLFRSETTDV